MPTIDPASAVAAFMLVALTVYALLGGADFGAGFWDLTARGDRAEARRELIAHAIGPVWEANHVWLIIVVVLLFTGFPAAFSAIMTGLHVPLSLMLVMIVLRGSAFTFRSYDNTEAGKHRWNRVFSVPSVLTPILLGSIIGAIASGAVGSPPGGTLPLFSTWLAPFPIVVGLFTLALFAYLAAVYLTLEATDLALREDFRRNALIAALVVTALAYAVYLLARSQAPIVFRGLDASPWGLPRPGRHRGLRDPRPPRPLDPSLPGRPRHGDAPGRADPLGLHPGPGPLPRPPRPDREQHRRPAGRPQAVADRPGDRLPRPGPLPLLPLPDLQGADVPALARRLFREKVKSEAAAAAGSSTDQREDPGGIVEIKARSTELTDSAVVNTRAMSGSRTTMRPPGEAGAAKRFGLALL